MELHIKRLLTLEEIYTTYPLVVQLTPELSEDRFRIIQHSMVTEGYCCIGAYCMEGELLGMCGYWVRHRFYCGKGFHIDNIVSATGIRGRGVGSVLMEWVEEEARAEGCDHIVLDTYLECKDAHAFYLTQGLTIRGWHFMRKL